MKLWYGSDLKFKMELQSKGHTINFEIVIYIFNWFIKKNLDGKEFRYTFLPSEFEFVFCFGFYTFSRTTHNITQVAYSKPCLFT